MEIIKQYKTYILLGIIILLIIIIGFMYSEKTTNKIEPIIEKEEVKKEEKEEVKKIFVEIKGEVKNPGVYELNDTERVIDVIKKANGLTDNADTNYLNLSKKVTDEMVIIIYSKDEIKKYEKSLKEKEEVKEIIKYEIVEKELPCPNIANEACINKSESINKSNDNDQSSSELNNQLINLNSASKEELMTLTGIGESKADLILDYRNTSKFNSIEDIKNVKGIGDSLFEKIKNNITV